MGFRSVVMGDDGIAVISCIRDFTVFTRKELWDRQNEQEYLFGSAVNFSVQRNTRCEIYRIRWFASQICRRLAIFIMIFL